ncbi:MAG TPA: hypothetical protein VG308_20145 [Stellaceae bacterium]|jgi:hypothetical protein|nr:hypothetical protein [Stellaceae bacterium]
MFFLTGWFLVNIVAPLGLPLFGIAVLKLLPLPPQPALKFMTAVKDGQLCWAVIAMGASTIYELWEALEAHRPVPEWAPVALGATIVMMLPAMVMAASGAVFSTPLLSAPAATAKAWIAHYKVFVGSLIMTLIAALTYSELHFSLPAP